MSSSGALDPPFLPLSLSASGDHGGTPSKWQQRRTEQRRPVAGLLCFQRWNSSTVAMAASSPLWRSIFPNRAVTTGRRGSAAVPFSLFPVSRLRRMKEGERICGKEGKRVRELA
nr:hypothetical protein Iba_scaffold1421CG0980 [Ipomoea batatas]